VKPLSPQCKNISAFSGCTIMGDGHVALILDVISLAQRAHVVSEVQAQQAVTDSAARRDEAATDVETLLVCKIGEEGRGAIPLRAVDRLEEFARDKIEHTVGNDVVQYRDTILPLLDIASVLGYAPAADASNDTVQVVVYAHEGRMVGLVVDRIVDIVEHAIVVHQRAERLGLVGSLVVDGAVTDLLDIDQIVRAVAGWDTDREAVRA
jgi:two-component system, chemotaxis family, sensor kinase CheA